MGVKVRQKDGKWWVFIDHNRRRKAKCIGMSKHAAQLVAEKIEARLALGQSPIMEEERSPILFADYAQQWLKTYASIHCKPATVEDYEATCRLHIFPAIGAKPLAAITREAVKQIIAEKIEYGLSRARDRGCYSNHLQQRAGRPAYHSKPGSPARTITDKDLTGERNPALDQGGTLAVAGNPTGALSGLLSFLPHAGSYGNTTRGRTRT
jgi:Phage integrase, N-terminal SAM-like domain